MVSAGFEERKHLNDHFIHLPHTDTILIIRRGKALICAVNMPPAMEIDCDKLHTLQNLFYLLSGGTELTISPDSLKGGEK